MDKTPKSKIKFSRKNRKHESVNSDESQSDSSTSSTPVNNNKNVQLDGDNDYSPLYFPTTQETNEEIDVLWDWHSPRAGEKRRKKQKRIVPVQSPNITIKRHNSQNFERLREELKALQQELSVPDDEDSLCVSPQQEKDFKEDDNNSLNFEKEQKLMQDFEDPFDDSLDDELLVCTQKIEKELLPQTKTCIESQSTNQLWNSSEIETLVNKYNDESDKKNNNVSLLTIKNENTGIKGERVVKSSLQRTQSEGLIKHNVIETVSGKLEFYRTKSFELDAISHNHGILSKNEMEKIEKNRLEALARLEAHKKQSSTKCSSEEIEKKRQQALAKLETKRVQDMVERNRQEALKRLQMNRFKKVGVVKGTLTKRL